MARMKIDIAGVERGACAFVVPPSGGRLAMVDCGYNDHKNWSPRRHLKKTLRRTALDYLFITHAGADHCSGLKDLVDALPIHRFYRNTQVTSGQFLEMQRAAGTLDADTKSYSVLGSTSASAEPAAPPFDEGMGGVTFKSFCSAYGEFQDADNLSMAVFFRHNGFQILFPGNLQLPGWRALLKSADFRDELRRTTILVASQQGRAEGLCPEVFVICKPHAVVISGGEADPEVQERMAARYGALIAGSGVPVGGQKAPRKVLMTRADGGIRFNVTDGTHFSVHVNFG
jgi:beta-lactamase superfamily II metal-dependent hydrolase